MGFQDEVFGQLARAMSRLESAVQRTSKFLRPELGEALTKRLLRLTDETEILAAQTNGWVQASLRATAIPPVEKPYVAADWTPIRGLPAWRIDLDNEHHVYRTFEDYAPPPPTTDVVIYLDEYSKDQLGEITERAFALADSLGYSDFELVETEEGSIWNVFKGKIKDGVSSDYVQQKMQEIDQRLSLEMLGKAQAEVDAIRTDNTAALIAAVAEIPNAVVRAGGVLLIKYVDPTTGDPVLLTRDLSVRELRALERNPGIQRDPAHALELLALAVQDSPDPQGPSALAGEAPSN
jgi:hypothetical protein